MENVRQLKAWKTWATALPVETVGTAARKHVTYKPGFYDTYGVNGVNYVHVLRPLTITSLEIEGQTWMVDDPPHWWAMKNYAKHSSGKVLVGGVGLGLLLHLLDENPDVAEVDAVDRNPDVIALARRHLPDDGKLTYLLGDFMEYAEYAHETGAVYDRILVDLWVARGVEQVRKLMREEVVPQARQLARWWPGATAVFHGFGGHPVAEFLVEAACETVRREEEGR